MVTGKHILFLLFLFSMVQLGNAQVEVLGDISQTDNLRLQQLTEADSFPHHSFLLRFTSVFQEAKRTKPLVGFAGIQFIPESIGWMYQSNSTLGLGNNQGSMLPNVGIQQRAQASLSLQWKFLHARFAPEWISGQNKEPQGFDIDPNDPNFFARYYLYIVNKVDMFSRYGKEPIKRNSWGQSSFTIRSGGLALGVSKENMWWGPGLRNALVMSNNGGNFPYLTLHSLKPIETGAGHFEGQLIYGNLENVRFEHPDHERMRGIWEGGIAIKDTSKRSIGGFMLNWQPKWVPNLHIGMAMSASSYRADTLRKLVSFPFSSSWKPVKQGSFFIRYALPEDHAEFYIEVGRGDRMATPFNILKDSIPLGYTGGVRKLVPIFGGSSHFYFGLEVTRLQVPDPRMIFVPGNPFGAPQTPSWYTSEDVRQGYTNNGQVMGAWIGPGSNSQTLQLGWIKGKKRIMLTGERVLHNVDFYYYNYLTPYLETAYQNQNKFWADINATAQIQWNFGNLSLSGAWSYTSLLNYRWVKLDGGFSGPSKLSDRRNTQIYASIGWNF